MMLNSYNNKISDIMTVPLTNRASKKITNIVGWLFLLLASCANASNISGTYVGRGANSAFIIQLVESNGSQVMGHYEQAVLQNDGKIRYMNASVTGGINGETIVATIKPSEFLGGSISVSGTVNDNSLHLNGGGNGDALSLNLTRGSENDFQTVVAALSAQGNAIQVKHNGEAQAQKIASLIKQEEDFSNQAAQATAKFNSAAPSYQKITESMRVLLAREQTIFGDGQAAVARGQIDIAINQDEVQAAQIHSSVVYDFNFFASTYKQLHDERLEAQHACAFAHRAAFPLGKNTGALTEQCSKFSGSDMLFLQRAKILQDTLTSEENSWRNENRAQDAIIKTADATSR
ncbi:MAG: hypothetical protein ACYC0M_08500 [Burkholderiales bacterium]